MLGQETWVTPIPDMSLHSNILYINIYIYIFISTLVSTILECMMAKRWTGQTFRSQTPQCRFGATPKSLSRSNRHSFEAMSQTSVQWSFCLRWDNYVIIYHTLIYTYSIVQVKLYLRFHCVFPSFIINSKYIYIYMYIYIHVYTYIYIYIYIHIYIYIFDSVILYHILHSQ